jgi:hypothetical protein
MKITNTLPYPTHALRRMVGWVCRTLGMPVKRLRLATFARSRNQWGGLCYGRSRVGIRLGKNNRYPTSHTRFGVTHVWADDWEILVAITAHEIGHSYDFVDRGHTRERSADLQMRQVLDSFRASRDALLAKWLQEPASRATKPVAPVQEQRAAKAQKALDRWQRKAKLAATKVRQYKRRVSYYERTLAAKRATP